MTFEFQTSRSKVPSFLSTEQSRHEAVYNQQEEAVNGHLYVVQEQSKLADGSKSVTNSRVFMSQPMAVTVKQQAKSFTTATNGHVFFCILSHAAYGGQAHLDGLRGLMKLITLQVGNG